MEKILSRTDAQDLEDYKQAAAVEAGLRREFLARAQKAEDEIERLRALVREVYDSARGDIRHDPGPSEILAETGWYKRAKSALGITGPTTDGR